MPTQTIRLDSNVMNMLHARAASQQLSVEEYTNDLLRVVLNVQLVAPIDVNYATMPGMFSEEEKQLRALESYHSPSGSSIDEVESMLFSI